MPSAAPSPCPSGRVRSPTGRNSLVLKDRLGGEFRSSGDVGSKYQAADESLRAALAAYSGLTNAAESGVHPLCPPGGPRDFRDGAAGKAGALVVGTAVRESVTLAGKAERARVARAFVGAVLRPGHPCGDDAALLVSELFGNSVRHSGSGAAGGTVTVAVRAWGSVVRVEVTDRSGPGVPEPRPAGSDAEGGRGLQLVEGLATRWGWRRRGGRTVTWFELRHD
jgi:anti-sigma regulatory factor (Ser/Thr protein kinase)